MKKIFLIFLFIFILTAKTAGAITYSELNRYVFASYTPANYTGKVLYVFEDPLCPYCHKLNEHIVKYSQKSGYKINLIFKIIHGEQAFTYAVDYVCGHQQIDNSNFIKYIDLDYSGNYCSYGKDLVLYDIKISNLLGVSITPSLISNTGFRESGLSLRAIKRGLGISR
jgi:protein-disulfide isomerase